MNRLCLSRRLLTGSLAVACAALAWAQGEVTSQDVSGNGMTDADTSATVYNITEGGALKFVAKANLNGKTIKVVPSETAGDYAVVFVAPNGNIQVPFEDITSATFTGSGNLALVGQCGNGGQRQQINVSGCDQSSFSGRLYVANAWNKPCDTWLAGAAFAKAAFCFSNVYDGKNPAPGDKEGSDKLLLSGDASLAGLMSNRAQDSVEASTDESRTLTLAPNEDCMYAGQMGSDAHPLSLTLNGGTGLQTLSGTKTLQNLTINAGNLALSGTTEVRGTYTVTKTSGANVTLTGTLTLPESVTIAVTDPSYSGEAAAYTFEGVKLFTAGTDGVTITQPVPLVATVNGENFGRVNVQSDGTLAVHAMSLASSAEGATYSKGAGAPNQAATTTLNVANGSLNLTGGTYYLNQCISGMQSTVNITNSTVTYIGSNSLAGGDACLGLGQATYTVGGSSKVTAPGFYLSNGADGRTSVFTLKDTAKLTVTGTSNVDSNLASIMFGHWDGPSTFTLQDSAQFIAEGADVLVGKTHNTQTININGGTFRARGIRCSNMDQTSSLNLSGGRVELGEGGLKDYGTQRLSVNVTGDAEIASFAAMDIAHTVNIATGKVLTLDGTHGAITVTAATPFPGEGTVTIKGTVNLPLGSEGKVTVAEGGVLNLQLTVNEMVNGYTAQAKTTGNGAIHLLAPDGTVASENGKLEIGDTCTWQNGTWTPAAPIANNNVVIIFDAEHPTYTFNSPVRLATLTIRGTDGTLDATADVPYASCKLETNVTTSTRFLNGFIGDTIEIPEGKTVAVAVAENAQEELKVALTGAGTLVKTGVGTLTLAKQTPSKTALQGGTLKFAGVPAGLSTAEGTTLVLTSGNATIADATPIKGNVKVEGGVLTLTATPITFPIELVGGDICAEKSNNGNPAYTVFNQPVTVGGGEKNARIRFTGWTSSGDFKSGLTLKDKAYILIEKSGAGHSKLAGNITVDAPSGDVYFGGTKMGNAQISSAVTGVGNVHLIQYVGSNVITFNGVFADKSETEKLAVTLECGHLRLMNAGNTFSGGTTVKSGVTYPVSSPVFGTGPVAINGTLETSGNLTLSNQLTGGGNLNLASGTLAVSHKDNTFSGKVVIASGATLDISAAGARLFVNGTHLSTTDAVTVQGTLKTRNWTYGNSLGWLGHNTPYVKVDGGTIVFTETFNSDRGFTVTDKGATLMVADGCCYTKDTGWDVTNNGVLRLACAENASGTMALGGTYGNTVTVGKGVTLKAPGTFATLTADEGATLDITGNLSVGTLTPPTGGKINVVGTEDATVTFTSEGADVATEVAKLAPAAGMVFETAGNKATLKVDTNAFTGLTGTVTPAQATVLAQAAQAAGVKPNAEGKIMVTLTEKGAGIPNASVEQITAALEIFSGVASVDANDPSVLKVAYNFGITAMSFANDTLTLTAKVENDSASAAFAEGVTVKLIAIDGNVESDVTTTTSDFDAGRQAVVFTLNDISTVTSRLLKVKAVK